jgi:PAS domain S-box-containing protein
VLQCGAVPTEPDGLDEASARLLLRSVVGYAIYIMGPDGTIRSWNPGAERIKGYKASEIIGRNFELFFTPEARAAGEPKQHLEAARLVPHESTGWRVRKGGERFWAALTLTPLIDETGTLRGYAKVTRDMTEHLKAEESRVRLTRVEEALRLRDEFLHRANQGLDQILAAIQLHLRTLSTTLEAEPTSGSAQVAARLATIDYTLKRIHAISENVLQLAADTGEQLVRRVRISREAARS